MNMMIDDFLNIPKGTKFRILPQVTKIDYYRLWVDSRRNSKRKRVINRILNNWYIVYEIFKKI